MFSIWKKVPNFYQHNFVFCSYRVSWDLLYKVVGLSKNIMPLNFIFIDRSFETCEWFTDLFYYISRFFNLRSNLCSPSRGIEEINFAFLSDKSVGYETTIAGEVLECQKYTVHWDMLILFKKNALFANLVLILFDFQLHKYAKSFRVLGSM